MSLLKERNHYKPFQYPWAFEAYDQQQKMHWLPSEVPLAEDVRDWNERLNDKEKNIRRFSVLQNLIRSAK